MLLILKIDYYDFLHPKEVLYKKLIELNNIKDPEMVSDVFEIDLVIKGFYLKDLRLLTDKYNNHFFFKDQLCLDKDISEKNKKINIVSEICTSIMSNYEKKLHQEIRYINFLNIFQKYRTKELLELSKEEIKNIIDSFLIDPYNENIFIFITNGSYFLLQLAVNISSLLFEEDKKENQSQMTDEKKKEFINKKINEKIEEKDSIMMNDLIKNEKNLGEQIFGFYKYFSNLRSNNIKHWLFYIGEQSVSRYQLYHKSFRLLLSHIRHIYP